MCVVAADLVEGIGQLDVWGEGWIGSKMEDVWGLVGIRFSLELHTLIGSGGLRALWMLGKPSLRGRSGI